MRQLLRCAIIPLVGALLADLMPLMASQVASGLQTHVSFTDTLPEPYSQGRVDAKLRSDGERIESLTVRLGKTIVEIPEQAFADLPKPDLRSLKLYYEQGDPTDSGWYVSIRFSYGEPDPDIPFWECGPGRFAAVEIVIVGGKCTERWIFERGKEGRALREGL